jgi:hypothetical protein
MRHLMFISIMSTMLSPLAMFHGDDPIRSLGRMQVQAEKVEAIELISNQLRKAYGRAETIIAQRIDELADEWLGQ